MSHDQKAMIEAHKAGQQLYRSAVAASINPPVDHVHAQAALYKTSNERIAFISGYFGERKRAAMLSGPDIIVVRD